MKCKYCEAELAGWGAFCPNCGQKNEEAEPLLSQQEIDFTEETEACDCAQVEENPVVEEVEAPSPSLKKAKRMAAMSGCVALLAVLATVLFFGIRGGWEVEKWFDWLKPRENTVAYKDSYTVEDKKVLKKRDDVVATMGDAKLTNAQLQIYYWSEVYNFLDSNYYYLSYIGFDYSKPLDEQACYMDAKMTWQQYFLQSAINNWQSNVAMAQAAKDNNFVMPEAYRSDLDTLEEDLQKTADKGGYESLDAMVQESFGAGVTFADYQAYMELYYMSYSYFESLYAAIDPTVEELEAYFTANEETLTGSGIKKDGSYTVDVRHILVMIDNIVEEMEKTEGDTDAQAEEDDKEEYTEEQWAACLAAAQKIYDEWLAGDKTEEHFGELANKYSHDQDGEVTNGGLYTFVEEGKMVEDFNSWCFEEGRKSGDTDIVKTQFGYHIMYFVGSEETWLTQTRSAYISAKSNEIVTNELSKHTIEVNYKKIVLGDVAL